MKKLFLFLSIAVLLAACGEKPDPKGGKITSISFEKPTLDLVHGDVVKLRPIIAPEGADQSGLVWESSADSVAAVDKSGVVEATPYVNIEGETTITLKDTKSGVSATCVVKVHNFHNQIKFTGWYGPWGDVEIIEGRKDTVKTQNEAGEEVTKVVPVAKGVYFLFANECKIVPADQEGYIRLSLPDGNCIIQAEALFPFEEATPEQQAQGYKMGVTYTLGDYVFDEWPVDGAGEIDLAKTPSHVFQAGSFDHEMYIDVVNNGGQFDVSPFQGALLFEMYTTADGQPAQNPDSYIRKGSSATLAKGPLADNEYMRAFEKFEFKGIASYFTGDGNKITGYAPVEFVYTPEGVTNNGPFNPDNAEEAPAMVRSNMVQAVSAQEYILNDNLFRGMNIALSIRFDDAVNVKNILR